MKKILVAIAATAALALSGCSITGDDVTDPSFKTLRYEGGDTGGSEFKECLDEGEKIVGNDKYYPYPTTQREAVWDSDNFERGVNSADYPDLAVTDADGRTVYVKMKISFFLNTSCEPLEVDGKEYPGGVVQVFHEKIGKTRGAYFNEDGKYGSGWLWAMNNYIATPATDYVSRRARTEKAETMYKSTQLQTDIQDTLAEEMPGLVNAGMETDLQFYDNFTVKIYKITPEQDYLDLLKEREDAQIRAQTAQANADAKVAEARANERVALAEARIKRAEISGYGGFDNYRCIYLADQGLNCAQPQYVVGGVAK